MAQPIARPLPKLTAWQLRVCNDTSLPIGQFYFNGDPENPGHMAPGDCSEYVESDPASFFSQLAAWVGKNELGLAAQTLPFGFYSFHVHRLDGRTSIERTKDHPAVVTRICNRTGHGMTSFTFGQDPTFVEKALLPDACAPYRLTFAAPAFHGGSAVLGLAEDEPTSYQVAPLPMNTSLEPGVWTFDVEIADANAHILRLHRHPVPD
jgi:hypothetical protein